MKSFNQRHNYHGVKSLASFLIVTAILFFNVSSSLGQITLPVNSDSLKTGINSSGKSSQFSNVKIIDTMALGIIKKRPGEVKTNAGSIFKKVNAPDVNLNVFSDTTVNSRAGKKSSEAKAKSTGEADKIKNVLGQSLGSLKKQSLVFNLTFESDNRYQPLPSITTLNRNQKFVSMVNVIGNISAWGIPLNFNYSTNQNLSYAPPSLINNMVKFDFNPQQFSSLYRSDFQQYYRLSSKAFGGLDLSNYTSQKLLDQLGNGKDISNAGGINSGLTKYIGDNANMAELLNMDEAAARKKLLAVAARDSTINMIAQSPEKIMSTQKENAEKALLKQKSLADLANVDDLKNRLSDKAYISSIEGLPKDDIVYNLSQATRKTPIYTKPLQHPSGLHWSISLSGLNLDIDGCINRMIARSNEANNAAIEQLADNIIANKKASGVTAASLFAVPQLSNVKEASGKVQNLPDEQLAKKRISDSIAIDKKVDSLVANISDIKKQLHANGFDVKQLLQIQNLLNAGGNSLGNSEFAQSLLLKKPANGFQNVFSKVDALKIGAFGNKLSGNQPRDMFMNGAHLTVKAAGNVPVTLGYGKVNDIGSFKDAGFQSSMYSSAQNLTYISAEFKRNKADNVKILMVSGSSTPTNSTLYTTPAISSNTIAFTLTKTIDMVKAGQFTVDLSKSTTQYANMYSAGSEALIDRKAGNTYNANNDLFEAFAFGFNHHLDAKQLGLTDNFYINYSGMGYQNPASNGLSGGRFRMGGNIKKSFYKNKLMFNLRSDLKTMPISYTSNDKWKTLQLQLDTRFVVNKQFNINFKYTTNGTSKRIDNNISPVYSLNKMQVNGNLTYKIGKKYTVSYFSIGSQNFSNPGDRSAPSANKTLLFNYTQSLIFNTNTLTASIFYNKELSGYKLIGNLLNTDIIYQYSLFKKLNLSSGLTYLENDKIARQVGVKQTVQLYASNRFDVDTYIDLRKNLIQPQYADLYASCRAEIVLRYHLNKK